jgi:sulfoquinovose isomerase
MGRPRADVIVDHGMNFLWDSDRDSDYGGTIGVLAMMDPRAQPSRPMPGLFSWPLLPPRSWAIQRPDGSSRDNATVIRGRFCEEQYGAVAEEFTHDWQPFDSYRGQNSNMHLTESLTAAFQRQSDLRRQPDASTVRHHAWAFAGTVSLAPAIMGAWSDRTPKTRSDRTART